jgi:hypothetical protein
MIALKSVFAAGGLDCWAQTGRAANSITAAKRSDLRLMEPSVRPRVLRSAFMSPSLYTPPTLMFIEANRRRDDFEHHDGEVRPGVR